MKSNCAGAILRVFQGVWLPCRNIDAYKVRHFATFPLAAAAQGRAGACIFTCPFVRQVDPDVDVCRLPRHSPGVDITTAPAGRGGKSVVPRLAGPSLQPRVRAPDRRVVLRAGMALLSATVLSGIAGAGEADSPADEVLPPPVLLAPIAPDPAPPLDGTWLDGIAPGPGAVTIVHVFATWCVPCRRELPAFARLLAGLKGLPVRAVLVDVAEPEARVRRFFPEGPPAPLLLDMDRRLARAFGVHTLPTTVVLDAAGIRRLGAVGEVDWDNPATSAAIRALLPASSDSTDTQRE